MIALKSSESKTGLDVLKSLACVGSWNSHAERQQKEGSLIGANLCFKQLF
jgi:hypothetical protein